MHRRPHPPVEAKRRTGMLCIMFGLNFASSRGRPAAGEVKTFGGQKAPARRSARHFSWLSDALTGVILSMLDGPELLLVAERVCKRVPHSAEPQRVVLEHTALSRGPAASTADGVRV